MILLKLTYKTLSTGSFSFQQRMAVHLFKSKDIAAAYANFRPVYPPTLKEEISNYVLQSDTAKFDFALDIGCGSGQSTLLWADTYKKVVGTDVSEAQINKSPQDVENVTFIVGCAETLEFENDSVDLVTIGQAMHWVDTEKFYGEVKRVLRKDAVFASYGYGNLYLNSPEANEFVCKYYEDVLWKGGFWDKGRHHINNKYADFTPLPFQSFKRVDSLVMTKEWTLDHFIGYLSSWSAYRSFLEKNPDSHILDDMKMRLRDIYGEGGLSVNWPVFILLGRK